MSDKMMRIAGRSTEGKAKAITSDEEGNIGISDNSKAELLLDEMIEVKLNGFHVFGETSGRGHQAILDVSKYKNITVILDVLGGHVGRVEVFSFSENNKKTGGATPVSDEAYLYMIGRTHFGEDGLTHHAFTPEEHLAFDRSHIGLQVYISSPLAGAKVRCRIIGGK